MATSSYIGLLNDDGSIHAIYCHNDGYLRHNGVMLMAYYQEKEKVKELIDLGDISLLEEKISPDTDQVHTFEDPQVGVTISYIRDRGDKNSVTKTFESLQAFINDYNVNEINYAYLYDNEKSQWMCTDDDYITQETLQPLEELLEENGINYENEISEHNMMLLGI